MKVYIIQILSVQWYNLYIWMIDYTFIKKNINNTSITLSEYVLWVNWDTINNYCVLIAVGKRREPGDVWMLRGPLEYIPPIGVIVIKTR